MKPLSFKQFLPAIAFLAFTFFLFTLPGQELPDLSWAAKINFDKMVHLGLFTILVFVFSYPFKKSTHNNAQRKKWFLYITLISIIYGVIIEIIQKYFVVNRSYDIVDITADTLGASIGYIIAMFLFKAK